MAYKQKNNPFKKRSDLRAAKKEEKNFPQESLTESEMMGFRSEMSVKDARKERRQLKKSIRKGTYEPTVRGGKVGTMNIVLKSTPGQDLSESRRQIRISKVAKKQRKKTQKHNKKQKGDMHNMADWLQNPKK